MSLDPKLRDSAVLIDGKYFDLADLKNFLATPVTSPHAKIQKKDTSTAAAVNHRPKLNARRRKKAKSAVQSGSANGKAGNRYLQSTMQSFLTPPSVIPPLTSTNADSVTVAKNED